MDMNALPTGWYEGTHWWVGMEHAAALTIMVVLSVMALRALDRSGIFAHARHRRHHRR